MKAEAACQIPAQEKAAVFFEEPLIGSAPDRPTLTAPLGFIAAGASGQSPRAPLPCGPSDVIEDGCLVQTIAAWAWRARFR